MTRYHLSISRGICCAMLCCVGLWLPPATATDDSEGAYRLSGRALWCGPSGAGRTPESVAEYVERLHRAHVNMLVMDVKASAGTIFWPSKRFPECVAEGYADFDFPAVLIEECRKRDMQVHAWFVDFYEGSKGEAYKQHPEWAMLNAKGEPTNSEVLRGKPYSSVWMCPAQRPGYTDQWLIPMMVEFAEMYDVDGIHHDYIRYPGDLAPDQYCFCDYCLEQIPRFAGYISQTHPDEPFHHESYDRPYIESH